LGVCPPMQGTFSPFLSWY